MTDKDQVIAYLNRYKKQEWFSLTDLERKTKVPRTTISRLLDGENVGIDVFFKVLKQLDLKFTLKEGVSNE